MSMASIRLGERGLDGLEVALADHEVVLDDAPERPHREGDLALPGALLVGDREDQVASRNDSSTR